MRALLLIFSATSSLVAANLYVQHNLVSNQAAVADNSDPNLVNPWGIAFSATGPFWITNQSTGMATIYNSAGKANASPVPTPAQPTGIVQNASAGFPVAPGIP